MDHAKNLSIDDAITYLDGWGVYATKVRVEMIGMSGDSFKKIVERASAKVEEYRGPKIQYNYADIKIGSGVSVHVSTRDI